MLTIFVATMFDHVTRTWSTNPIAYGVTNNDIMAKVQLVIDAKCKEYGASIGPTHVVTDEGLDGGTDLFIRCGTRQLVTIHVSTAELDIPAATVEPTPVVSKTTVKQEPVVEVVEPTPAEAVDADTVSGE